MWVVSISADDFTGARGVRFRLVGVDFLRFLRVLLTYFVGVELFSPLYWSIPPPPFFFLNSRFRLLRFLVVFQRTGVGLTLCRPVLSMGVFGLATVDRLFAGLVSTHLFCDW